MKKRIETLIIIITVICLGVLTTVIFDNGKKETKKSEETNTHTDAHTYMEATIGEAISTDLLATIDNSKENISEENLSSNIIYETTEGTTMEYEVIVTTPTSADTSNMTYLGTYSITAYCPCEYCCGKTDGITASGTQATAGRTVGCNSLPFGTVISINGQQYVVEDRGGMSSNVIDIFFNTHQEALNFGRQTADVYIVN